VFSLPKPAQVTSVVLFNIGPVTPNRINGLFDPVTKPRQIPTENQTKWGEIDSFRTISKVLVYVFCSKRIDFRVTGKCSEK